MKKIMLLIALLMVSINGHAAGEVDTDLATSWLETIDAGNYEESWDLASSFFQSQLSKEQWEQALSQVRKPLGDVVLREIRTSQEVTSPAGAPEGEYLVFVFSTSFESRDSATETVSFTREEDQWLAVGYFIQ